MPQELGVLTTDGSSFQIATRVTVPSAPFSPMTEPQLTSRVNPLACSLTSLFDSRVTSNRVTKASTHTT